MEDAPPLGPPQRSSPMQPHHVVGFHLSLEIDGDADLPLFNLRALVTADKALGKSAAHLRHSSQLFGGKV